MIGTFVFDFRFEGYTMTRINGFSEKEIKLIFDKLGINLPNTNEFPPVHHLFNQNLDLEKQIYFSKLSNNSLPPPTGENNSANLERLT